MSVVSPHVCVSARSLRQTIPVLVSALFIGLSFSGCRQQTASPSVAPASARTVSVSAAITQVRTAPLYRQAHEACKRHDYRRAADLLQNLAATPGLLPEAAAFVQEQRTICLKDAGLPGASVPGTVSRSVQPSHDADCGPRALLLVCQKLGVKTDLAALRRTAGTTRQGTTLAGLQQAVEKLGLKAEGVQVSREALPDTSPPAIAWINRNHYIALLDLSGSGEQAQVTIHDPNQTKEQTLSHEQFLQRSGGYLLLIHR